MGFEDRKEHGIQVSRKGKLSYLLNDGEDEAMPRLPEESASTPHLRRHHNYDRSSGGGVRGNDVRNPRGGPSGMNYNNQGQQSRCTPLPISQQMGGGLSQGYLAQMTERGGMQRLGTGGEGQGSEKRGVRKKRQRKFVCDTCGFGFYTNSDLQKHNSSVHLLLRPYECSMCNKKFGERSNATKHFKSVHERQKNAACEICHKVFAFRDGLVRHVRLVHENVRNFHCQHAGCGQSFKQSAHLKKHEQVHNKSRAVQQHGERGGSGASRKEAGRRGGSGRL